jgi:hypothetical protein
MSPNMEPVMNLYRANIDVCRHISEILFEGTERIERTLFKNLRDGMRQAFTAVNAASDGSNGAEAFRPPQFEDLVSSYREVLETAIKTNAELARAVTEHYTKCSKSMSEVNTPGLPIAGMMAAPGEQLESMMKLWNQTSQHLTDLAQHFTQTATTAATPDSTPKKTSRTH